MDTNEHRQSYDSNAKKNSEMEKKKNKDDTIFAKISIAKECFKIKKIVNKNVKDLQIRFIGYEE